MAQSQEINDFTDTNILPYIALRCNVIFPGMHVHFDITREPFIAAVNQAAKQEGRQLLIATQKDPLVDCPEGDDLYSVGVLAVVRQILHTSDGITRVLIYAQSQVQIYDASMQGEYPEAVYCLQDPETPDPQTAPMRIATMRCIQGVIESLSADLSENVVEMILCEEDPIRVFNDVVYNIGLPYTDKQRLLEELNWDTRLRELYRILHQEQEIMQMMHEIQDDTQASLEQSQKDYYLREQMHQIAAQLGEVEDPLAESNAYHEKIAALPLEDVDKEKLFKEANRLATMTDSTPEADVIRSHLDAVLALPWTNSSHTKVNLKRAEATLERDHYGLKNVKQRILESFAVRALLSEESGQILCFVGPPGVGKTSIGISIAHALGRKYARISLGGIRDESDIRGHRKTYVGAMPGRIIDALTRAGTNNPVIVLDEVDKMSKDFQGDPSAAMLEVLDSEQNKAFCDHYIDVPFDLSHVMFIATANSLDDVPAPLQDRMDVIEINSYTREEKFHIAREHLVRKQMKKNGLKGTQIRIPDDVIYALIDGYTREAGVRELERMIGTLCRKTARQIVEGTCKRVAFSPDMLQSYLGVPKYRPDMISHEDAVGVVNGLAWTSVGGVMMPIEVLSMPGKGHVECTGSLGEVMQESAKLAVSYTRSVAEQYHIPADFYTTQDLHIHAPEGAVPKDGPSAGVTMATALVSALSGRPVRGDVAMTGEITLHGKVLPIGGLREKTMAAYKAGIKTVIIPEENVPDLDEIDPVVKDHIAFQPAKTMETVLQTALLPADADTSTTQS